MCFPATPPLEPPAYFKCYEVEDGDDIDVTVSLQDQFDLEPEDVLVERPELFCNPVNKNDEGISNATAHLTGYELDNDDEDFEPLDVLVTNQFGEQLLVLEEPELLLVPSTKDNVGELSDLNLDHFKCYEVEDGDDIDVIVSLQDQFDLEPEDVLVERPELFCNPVDKNGQGILDETAHLTCYEIEDEKIEREVLATNQLDDQFLVLAEPKELLCVPSEKLDVLPHESAEDDDSESDSD